MQIETVKGFCDNLHMKYCIKCGHELEDGDEFCRECGAAQAPSESWSLRRAVKVAFRKTFVFSGTASPAEFWLIFLFLGICSTVFSLVEEIIIIKAMVSQDDMSQTMRMYQLALAVFTVFFMFLIIGPAVRRYHDSGRSGAWFMVPVVNFILLFKKVHIWCTQSGKSAFDCRLSVEYGYLIKSILNHLESSLMDPEHSVPRIVDSLTDSLPDLPVYVAMSQDFSLDSRDLCDQVVDLLSFL